MELNTLSAISPIDGRYRSKTSLLSSYFSEWGLIKYRIKIELEYFIALYKYGIPQLSTINNDHIKKIKEIIENFSEKDAENIKDIEKSTNHDVKAVEYFLKEKFDEKGLGEFKEFIHFGLTSQDINNTAIPLSLKDASNEVVYPQLEKLILKMGELSATWSGIPMLARTHGQPATPTLFWGKN